VPAPAKAGAYGHRPVIASSVPRQVEGSGVISQQVAMVLEVHCYSGG